MHSVREFILQKPLKIVGMEIEWQGKGIDEKGMTKQQEK